MRWCPGPWAGSLWSVTGRVGLCRPLRWIPRLIPPPLVSESDGPRPAQLSPPPPSALSTEPGLAGSGYLWVRKGSVPPFLGFPASAADLRRRRFPIRRFVRSKPPPPLLLPFSLVVAMDRSRGSSSDAVSGLKRGRDESGDAAADLEFEASLRAKLQASRSEAGAASPRASGSGPVASPSLAPAAPVHVVDPWEQAARGAGRDLRAPPRLLPRLLPWVGRRGRRRRAAAGRPASFLVVALGPRPGVRLALRRDVVLARVPSVVLLEMASSLRRLLVVRTVTPLTPRFLIPSSPASRVIALAISSLGARTLLSVSSVGRMDT